MAILDIFKKKKEKKEKIAKPVKAVKTKEEFKPEEKPAKVREKEISKEPVLEKIPKEKKAGEGWRILKSPHITEKATDLTKKNQYVFKVWPKVNKIEIKKAIESLYGVDVVSVKIINIPSKKRRLGRIEGLRKGYKKAIIRIKEGQKIEVLPR